MFDTDHCVGLDAGDVTFAPIRWAEFEPAGWVLDAICAEPEKSLDDEAVLDRVEALERIRAAVDAEQALALAEFASRREDGAARTSRAACAGDEIGLALRIAGRTADCRIDTSVELCERMPAAVRAMRAGGLTLAKARVLLEETANLDAAAAAAVADQLLGAAPEMTPGGLRRRARRLVVGVDADAAAKRRAAAERGRRVRLYPDADGMATICAHLGAPDAVAIFSRIDQIARAGKAAGDARTLDQLRADALVDILYGGAGPAGRPLVQMLLPADRVRAGRTGADRTSADRTGADGAGADRTGANRTSADAAGETAPAELVGYGPIDDDLALALAATASWQRLLTDPVTGQVIDVGRTRYRPPASLADLVRARDRCCSFPGCLVPAARCDIDHRHRWTDGGETAAANLSPLCGRHHDTKDGDHGWTCRTEPDGTTTWTTPTGRTYTLRIDRAGEQTIQECKVERCPPAPRPPRSPHIEPAPPF